MRDHGRERSAAVSRFLAAGVPELLAAGAGMIGGCCGTTPAHIAACKAVVDSWNAGLGLANNNLVKSVEVGWHALRYSEGRAGPATRPSEYLRACHPKLDIRMSMTNLFLRGPFPHCSAKRVSWSNWPWRVSPASFACHQ